MRNDFVLDKKYEKFKSFDVVSFSNNKCLELFTANILNGELNYEMKKSYYEKI